MYRMSLLAVFLGVFLIASGSSALSYDPHRAAHVATPTVTFPVTPAPVDCTVEPRATESLLALLGTPPAPRDLNGGPQGDGNSLVQVPVGRPASGEVTADIMATVHQLHACFNAGDLRRAFALVTDGFLRDFASEETLTPQDIAFFIAEPTPVPMETQTTILAVTDISVLPGGQAAAFVVLDQPFAGPDTVYIIFSQEDGHWQVDEIKEFL